VRLLVIITVLIVVVSAILYWWDRRKLTNESGPQREDRVLRKLKPFFRRETVKAKVESLFPEDARANVFQLLDDDLPDVWGLERVQLAILKLSDGNVRSLRDYVAAARADCTQVIGLAEYPGAVEMGLDHYVRLPDSEQEAIARRDLHQYLRWLRSR